MNKKLVISTIAACALAFSLGPASSQPIAPGTSSGFPSGLETVLVPKATPIVVALNNGLSSSSATVGQRIEYTVVQDVVFAGHVIARSGDEGFGTVLQAQHGLNGFLGIGHQGADLRIGVERINNFCGQSIDVNFVRTEYRNREGALGVNRNLAIASGQKYLTRVAHTTRVCGQITEEQPQPLPSDALGPDRS